MDIENMHPFCLPFSLCHDATSALAAIAAPAATSGGGGGGATGSSAQSTSCSTSCASSSSSSSSSTSCEASSCESSSCESSGDQQLDELLDTVLESTGSSQSAQSRHSILSDDSACLMMMTGCYASLQLDIGLAPMEVIAGDDDDPFGLGTFVHGRGHNQEANDDEKRDDEDDDDDEDVWFPTTNCSLLSPHAIKKHPNVFHQHHHQVVIDPLLETGGGQQQQEAHQANSIKSSPTLAQLNLNNSNNELDPTEGLWGSSNLPLQRAKHQEHNQQHHQQHHQQHNHPHHQQQQQQQLCTTSTLIAAPIKLGASLASTNALQQAAAQQRLQACAAHSLGSLAPFERRASYQACQQLGAPKQQTNSHQPNFNNANNNNNNNNNHNDLPSQQTILSCTCQQHAMHQQQQQQRRCASPALVSSSSSPPTSCAQQHLQQHHQTHQAAGPPESKLKENIDYLTALLCKGQQRIGAEQPPAQQQLQSQQQSQAQPQAPAQISSTVNKSSSYSTLAQSLASGPKLLERPASSYEPADAPAWFRQHQRQQSPAAGGADKCAAAADSTAEAGRLFQQQQQQQHFAGQQPVLSSLLGCASPAGAYASAKSDNGGQPPFWAHQNGCQLHQNEKQQSEIPPNGRPITLTPLVSNNTLIIQQQRQQQQQLQAAVARVGALAVAQPKLFVQPGSPSASSTASSCALAEIGSSSSSSCASSGSSGSACVDAQSLKRQRASPSCATSAKAAKTSAAASGEHSQAQRDDLRLATAQTSALGARETTSSPTQRDSDDDSDDVDSDDESFYGDYTNNDLIGASISDNADCKWTLNMGRTRRNGQKRFFWQYNVQSKGPKGARLSSGTTTQQSAVSISSTMATGSVKQTSEPERGDENPFVLPEASDPVFSNDCQVEGVKHSGKARRGDGNDLTPNPRKLLMIGLELKKLSKIINELAPVTELPVTARNKTRKEKNKLASRACRLKKKAQHEANKIKLYGLQREHAQVVAAIYDVRKLLARSLTGANNHSQRQQTLSYACQTNTDNQNKQHQICVDQNLELKVRELSGECSMQVAGQSSDYVNSVLEKVVSGCIDGGLQT